MKSVIIIHDSENLDSLFNTIHPFNIKKDVRELNKYGIQMTYVEEKIELQVKSKGFRNVYKEKKKENNTVKLVKMDMRDPVNNRGVNAGLRVIALLHYELLKGRTIVLVLNIYKKTGSGSLKKSDITNVEKNKATELLDDYFDAV